MKQWLKTWLVSGVAVVMGTSAFAPAVDAHPGRTDKNGGHYCRTNCEKWGLEYGEYHYHNGKSSSAKGSSSSKGANKASSGSNTKSKSSKSKSANKAKSQAKSGAKSKAATKKPAPQQLSITILLNNESVQLPSKPVRHEGQVLLPLIDTLNVFDIPFSISDKSVHIKLDDRTVIIPIRHNESNIQVDGQTVNLSTPMIVSGGRLMVPLQLFRDALPCTLEWDETLKQLSVTLSGVESS
ncbi:copper amine oxidase N-terminal domain-containing protein [Paenibacillus apiarius]|uniref:copper amine oxidase N-terminal domain-containing protein n=1 Tax=Paenibacillus apiarius TaxID=46240 RepID=UPI0019819567|nr:copper amine oxidase N-terminal domain-containing protein [Paenibacillus apiarius]MBN3522529.1 copper amine oxidase N-terminal domain-containing protein [Paenibacillus apiarius]